jgi:hypothetical protein
MGETNGEWLYSEAMRFDTLSYGNAGGPFARGARLLGVDLAFSRPSCAGRC